MPEVTLITLELDKLSPPELEQRRREIVLDLRSKYPDYDSVVRLGNDTEVSLLLQLAVITSALRHKASKSGPPKEPRKPRVRVPISLDDL